ncbi:MAG: LysR family transcriptional regulator [Motiliproteus sp.]
MDTKWIEDFLALAKHGSFTKAAESRFVTQPAFSRRIRSLENWLGVTLVDRSTYPTKLTKIGVEMVTPMGETLNNIYDMRSRFQEKSNRENMLLLSTQHSLAVSFFPQWYNQISSFIKNNGIRVNASNLHDCIDFFLSGHSDFLLCYSSPNIYPELEREGVTGVQIGVEHLLPVCPAAMGLKTEDKGVASIDLVGFPSEAFFGRLIQKECISALSQTTHFELVYETALTEGVKAMVMQGAGMAWLPARLVQKELDRNELELIEEFPVVEMKIMLYRQSNPCKEGVMDFWQHVCSEENI